MQLISLSVLRVGAGVVLLGVLGAARAELTLAAAEAAAGRNEPGQTALQEKQKALEEQAVADGQLSDPKLKLGVISLPTDSFNLDQEPMTQLQIGLQQSFPPGDTLAHRSRRTARLAEAQGDSGDARGLEVLKSVRQAWLEAYYWAQAAQVVDKSLKLFGQLVTITQAHYASGNGNQQDVVQADLELERLKDRALEIRTAEDRARADLGRWVGSDRAAEPLPRDLPKLPPVLGYAELVRALEQHPLIQAESARVEAGDEGVAVARAAYKPRWMLDLSYGARAGRNAPPRTSEAQRTLSIARTWLGQQGISYPNYGVLNNQLASVGTERADLLSVMVTVDLPLFPGNRQDRRLAASRHEAEAAMRTRDDRLRELRRTLDETYATWSRDGERLQHYRSALIPRARENREAALNAYQSDRGDFNSLMRARIAELDTRLEALRLAVDRAKAQAGLLYLAGGMR